MNADNWACCPNCRDFAEQQVTASYGKVSIEDYSVLFQKAKETKDRRYFREEWEIGTRADGSFSIRYRGLCTECGLRFEFNHTVSDIRRIKT